MSEPENAAAVPDPDNGGAQVANTSERTDETPQTEPPRMEDALAAAKAASAGLSYFGDERIRANTVIFGDASIGTLVGRDQRGAAQRQSFVPSGQVALTLLRQLERTFVPPEVFPEMCGRLRRHSILVLRAQQGWGRTAAALRVLDDTCSRTVHKLNPDVRLRTLDIQFDANTGYLLESVEVEDTTTLRAFHFDELARTLGALESRMIVILDSQVKLSDEITPFLIDGAEPADPKAVVDSHFRRYLAGRANKHLSTDESSRVVQSFAQSRPSLREYSALAEELAEVAAGTLELARVEERITAATGQTLQQWFDHELDDQARSYAIALAVFNGLPSYFVSDAGHRLTRLITATQLPGTETPPPPAFGTQRSALLDAVKAETYSSTESTGYGQVPVQAVRFIDSRYPSHVLAHVWQEHHAVHEPLRSWLEQCVDTGTVETASRAGAAIGALSKFEFERIKELLITPWADSGAWRFRYAASAALQIPGVEPAYAPVVTRMLADWLRRSQPLPRRETAATALGNAIGQASPGLALRLLRRAARSTESSLNTAVCQAMAQLFHEAELNGPVLAELRQWCDSQRLTLRNSGFRCTLQVSSNLDVDTARSARSWPVMLWLANESPEKRDHIVTLFARLLEAPNYMLDAYSELRRWVQIADKDARQRDPLGRLLLDIVRVTQDRDSMAYYLHDWAVEPAGPARAVSDILRVLEQEGS